MKQCGICQSLTGPELRTVGPHPGGRPNNSMAIWIGMASGSGLASTILTSRHHFKDQITVHAEPNQYES